MYIEQDEINDDSLKKLEVSGGFTSPPLYFDRLRTHILNRTVVTEQHQPIVPDGYFEQSRSAILSKTVDAPPKIVALWYDQPLRYAAAAVIISGLTFAFWPSRLSLSSQNAISTISDEEILQYLEQTDLRDINISDVNFTSIQPSNAEVEQYIINQSDEHLLLEHL